MQTFISTYSDFHVEKTEQQMFYFDFYYQGAVYGIMVHWDCNLDHSEDSCLPKYSYQRYVEMWPSYFVFLKGLE